MGRPLIDHHHARHISASAKFGAQCRIFERLRFNTNDGVAVDRACLNLIEETSHFLGGQQVGNVVGHRVIHATESKARDLSIDERRAA